MGAPLGQEVVERQTETQKITIASAVPSAFEHMQLCAQKTGFERVIESLVNAVDLKKKAKLSVIVTPPECH